jgi:hypothetical protein
MTLSGIEYATFRLVALRLNQLRCRVPLQVGVLVKFDLCSMRGARVEYRLVSLSGKMPNITFIRIGISPSVSFHMYPTIRWDACNAVEQATVFLTPSSLDLTAERLSGNNGETAESSCRLLA